MRYRCLIPIIAFLFSFQTVVSQKLPAGKLFKIEHHPTEQGKYVVKFYDKNSRKLCEQWEMISSADSVTASNFAELWKEGKIFPHGKHYKLYKNRKRELEENYNYGYRTGKFTGFYKTGEIAFEGNYNRLLDGKLLHFYKNGIVKEESNFNNGLKTGKTIYFDTNGNKTYEINYLNGLKYGKSVVYFPDGKSVKRKMKYKAGKLISEKCFDTSGKKTDCLPLIEAPEFAGGTDGLKDEIEKIDFGPNSQSETPDICSIELFVETNGQVHLSGYKFPRKELLKDAITNWADNLPDFKPMHFDGVPKESVVNLTFPVNGSKVIWLGDLTVQNKNIRYENSQTDYETFFWEFPYPKEHLIILADKMPQFPGGTDALNAFIKKNIIYPEKAKKLQMEGRVYVSFVIGADGKLSDFKIKKSVNQFLDNEALRVIKLMPDWIPGETAGKNVPVPMAIPVNFRIN